MSNKNRTGRAKYDSVARDWRIEFIRLATIEEAEGDPDGVVALLAEGFTWEGFTRVLAFSVTDLRNELDSVEDHRRDDDDDD